MLMSWLPQNVSTFGTDIDSTLRLIIFIVGPWFILAEGLILYFAIRYRKRPGTPAVHVRGETFRQAAWVLIPGVIVMLLDFSIDNASGRAWDEAKIESPAPALNVQVTAERFAWIFTYPGHTGAFDGKGTYWSMGKLYVPVNQVVRLNMRSMDVIHSFAVPNLRMRQDIVPGRTITAWFEATRPGNYGIQCTELCGFDHYKMQGTLVVLSADDFAKWRQKHWPSAPAIAINSDAEGANK